MPHAPLRAGMGGRCLICSSTCTRRRPKLYNCRLSYACLRFKGRKAPRMNAAGIQRRLPAVQVHGFNTCKGKTFRSLPCPCNPPSPTPAWLGPKPSRAGKPGRQARPGKAGRAAKRPAANDRAAGALPWRGGRFVGQQARVLRICRPLCRAACCPATPTHGRGRGLAAEARPPAHGSTRPRLRSSRCCGLNATAARERRGVAAPGCWGSFAPRGLAAPCAKSPRATKPGWGATPQSS